jgi:hypothetical protein
MAKQISPDGIPIMQVYGLTVDHDGPFWINEADFNPELHRPAEEDEPDGSTGNDGEPDPPVKKTHRRSGKR